MVDIRQIVANNIYLPQIAEAEGKLGDSLVSAIDSELTSPLRIRASIPASLIVRIGDISVSNPEHGRSRTIPPINGMIPSFSNGTITLPSVSGGFITNNKGGPIVHLNVAPGYYIKVGVNINSSGQLYVSTGTTSTVSANAGIPPIPQGCRSVGYFTAYNLSGTIQNITNGVIVQYPYAISSGAEGAVFVKWGTNVTSGPYTVASDDYIIPIDTTSAVTPLIINLPAVTSLQKGRQLVIKDVGGNVSKTSKYANIVPNGSDNIEGVSGSPGTIRMDMDRMSLTFVCDGLSGWWIC